LREQIVETYARRCKLNALAVEVLRLIVADCAVRGDLGGKFSLQLPSQVTLEQQIRIARPLWKFLCRRREQAILQLERIPGVGITMARIARHSLANPMVMLSGKSPLDGYLRVCRESAMHWGIVRALEHLRDALVVTREAYFTDPDKHSVGWRLNVSQITPAMLHRVERCLRDVDPRAIREPDCNRWLKGLQEFFEQVKAGTFQLPARSGPTQPALAGKAPETADPQSAAPSLRVAKLDDVPRQSRALYEGLRELRERLLPQHLERRPEDFAALCRSEPGVWDFAQRLGAAIERFSVRCLTALRQKFLEDCGADQPIGTIGRYMAPASGPSTTEGGGLAGGDVSPADAAAEVAKCVPRLAEEAALLRSWLERELPQEENSLGRRTLTLVENSLVSGLFVLFLRHGFAEFFHDAGDEEGGDPRRAEGKGLATRRAAIVFAIEASLERQQSTVAAAGGKGESSAIALDVVKCCEAALAAVAPLFVLAGRGGVLTQRVGVAGRLAGGDARRDEEESPVAGGKIYQRFLSAEAHCADAPAGALDHTEFVEYEPGVFPPLQCRYFPGEEAPGTRLRVEGPGRVPPKAVGLPVAAQVCRFWRKGGVAFSPDIAVPVAVLFGEESRMARTADFLAAAANRHLAHGRQLAGSMGFRQCLPYLENQAAQWARIQLRQGTGGVTLLALPTAAMAMSDDFAENFTLANAIQKAQAQSPAREVLLRAVDAFWRAKGIAPDDYSLCVLQPLTPVEGPDEAEADDQRLWQRRVRRFLNQKARWPLKEAEEILNALGIVIEPKADGAPHGKVRLGDRHHTLSSKLLKDGQVFATYLWEWIRTLGQERLLADLLRQNDPRLAPYMRKADAAEE
jgi:hypothetical protein